MSQWALDYVSQRVKQSGFYAHVLLVSKYEAINK